jgi:hypothetical protein
MPNLQVSHFEIAIKNPFFHSWLCIPRKARRVVITKDQQTSLSIAFKIQKQKRSKCIVVEDPTWKNNKSKP